MSNGDDRGRTLQSILDALATAQNPRVTAPLAEAALDTLATEVRRAALTLQRCAPALLKLDVAAEGARSRSQAREQYRRHHGGSLPRWRGRGAAQSFRVQKA